MAATLVPPGRWTLRHGFVCLASAVVAHEYCLFVRLGELRLWSASCSHIHGRLLISRCLWRHALAIVVFVVWMYSIANSGRPRLSLRLVRCACWRIFRYYALNLLVGASWIGVHDARHIIWIGSTDFEFVLKIKAVSGWLPCKRTERARDPFGLLLGAQRYGCYRLLFLISSEVVPLWIHNDLRGASLLLL